MLAFLICVSTVYVSFAQSISGKVVDEKNEPMQWSL